MCWVPCSSLSTSGPIPGCERSVVSPSPPPSHIPDGLCVCALLVLGFEYIEGRLSPSPRFTLLMVLCDTLQLSWANGSADGSSDGFHDFHAGGLLEVLFADMINPIFHRRCCACLTKNSPIPVLARSPFCRSRLQTVGVVLSVPRIKIPPELRALMTTLNVFNFNLYVKCRHTARPARVGQFLTNCLCMQRACKS